MQQIDEIIQGAFMEAHFRVKCSHPLKDLHAAAVKSPATRAERYKGSILVLTKVYMNTATSSDYSRQRQYF